MTPEAESPAQSAPEAPPVVEIHRNPEEDIPPEVTPDPEPSPVNPANPVEEDIPPEVTPESALPIDDILPLCVTCSQDCKATISEDCATRPANHPCIDLLDGSHNPPVLAISPSSAPSGVEPAGHPCIEPLTPEEIGFVCYEVNRAYRLLLGQSVPPPANQATPEAQQSTVVGVHAKLNCPGISPAMQHENWRSYKAAAGWKYGEVEDAQAKTHPNMVPYHKLPVSERRKDALFCAIVAALTSDL